VDFDQDVELEAAGFVVEALEGVVVEGGDDEEDGIRAGDDGLVDLDRVDGEVLAEEGRVGELGDLGEVA
jgi:hypothetical protein